jgi:hypothetical protein
LSAKKPFGTPRATASLRVPSDVALCRLVGFEPVTALSILLTISKSRQSTFIARQQAN